MLKSVFVFSFVLLAFGAQAQPIDFGMERTLAQSVEAARVYLRLPEPEILPPEELEPILAYWDEQTSSSSILERNKALSAISHGQHLRYGNPELTNRVASLFVFEWGAFADRAQRGLALADVGLYGPGESYQDYMDGVEMLGCETFSPRIYDTALTGLGGGSLLRKVYLITVNPNNTLGRLLEMAPRGADNQDPAAACLDHPSGAFSLGMVDDGLQIIALLCDLLPELVVAERERVLDYVYENATFFGEPPVPPSDPPEPKRLSLLDQQTRNYALRVLEFLAEPGDIPLIQEIMRDPPLTRQQISRGVTTSDTTVRGAALIRRLEEAR